jgi:hypothetical protein
MAHMRRCWAALLGGAACGGGSRGHSLTGAARSLGRTAPETPETHPIADAGAARTSKDETHSSRGDEGLAWRRFSHLVP